VGTHYVRHASDGRQATQWVPTTLSHVKDPTAEIAAAVALPTRAEQAKALGEVLNRIPELSAHVRRLRQQVVKDMHTEDAMSWDEIGKAIGQHRTRAAQIARGVPGGSKKKTPPADADEA
jgi:hypothetical protein